MKRHSARYASADARRAVRGAERRSKGAAKETQ
jgi:hypothetical protein